MRHFPLKSCLLSMGLLQTFAIPTEATLLTAPALVLPEELEGRVKTLSLGMPWQAVDTETHSLIGFNHKGGKTTFSLQIEESFPENLASFEEMFTVSTSHGKKVWTFVYGEDGAESPVPVTGDPLSLEEFMGRIHAARVLETSAPQSLELSGVIEHIREKRCVFYTGAGISAGVVLTMPQLMKKLHLNGYKEKERFTETVSFALQDPASYMKPMEEFYGACLYGEPTPAHSAIRDIARGKNWGVLTENLDLLHQRSGINPLHHNGKDWLRTNVREEDLQSIEYVITVGLASDESGFLGWYKEANPAGIIIALNLSIPPYVGAEDFVVVGEAQHLLPSLCKAILGEDEAK